MKKYKILARKKKSFGPEISNKNIIARQKFIKKYLTWQTTDWIKIAFSDESDLYPDAT